MKPDYSIKVIDGVGPKIAANFERLGIETVRDLVFNYPRLWQDFSQTRPVAGLRLDEVVILKVKIKSIEEKRSHKKWMSIIEAMLEDENSDEIKAIWFNQTFLKNILKIGDEWLILGKVGWDFKNKQKTFTPTQMEKEPIIMPVYCETVGLNSKFIRKIIRPILNQICHSGPVANLDPESSDLIDDYLPSTIIESNNLVSLQTALANIHFPKSQNDLNLAKKRLAFDELFLIALRFLTIKKDLQQNVAPKMEMDKKLLKEYVETLPYKLTDAQRKTAWQIIQDLERAIPMNRLLEGDVGSGKTVVAAMAALVAIKNNYQVVWLAPTEILANQHFENVSRLLTDFNIKTGLLTSANRKADLINDNLIIGTHALIQKDIIIPNLGLIIIDEQHRFGVKQRGFLRNKTTTRTCKVRVGEENMIPHLLSMTATPIPRTLALALYGDLDISIINEMPKGRQIVETRIIEPSDREKAYDFIENQVKSGRQVFVVCPLIENQNANLNPFDKLRTGMENDNVKLQNSLFEVDKKSVIDEYKKLSEKVFPNLRIGLMHGKLKSKEKAEVMEKFKNNEISILVSTAVVEVGIDIANATVMMIESADRFGLAQLHQFRGRVGRGSHQSYCFLFSDSESINSKIRLQAMTECYDGFTLAQKDLELRGPGEVIGIRQSGLEDLKMASLSDTVTVEAARSAAEEIIDKGIQKYPKLVEKLKEFEIEKHLE